MISQAVVFCNTLEKVNWLSEKLRAHNLTVSTLVLNMDAQQCNEILVRTDTLKVDTDISQVNLVINYDLPTNCETYIRR
jgi:ATP-dependent RNA helicase